MDAKTAVDSIFVGRDRAYNRRFQQMCGHYLVDPVACTPASGWEKGQVENQVGVVRRRFFVPRPRFKSYAEFNDAPCCAIGPSDNGACSRIAASPGPRPTPIRNSRIARPGTYSRPNARAWFPMSDRLMASTRCQRRYPRPVSCGSTVRRFCKRSGGPFARRTRYSVDARAVGRPVEIRAYAERIEFWQDGKVVGQHDRAFGRNRDVYDPLHYIPVLARKPGALRNGAPFKDWNLPPAIKRVQRKLGKVPNGDRLPLGTLRRNALPGSGWSRS